MLSREDEYLEEAANAIFMANADEIVRQQCQAREDAERRERTLEKKLQEQAEQLKEKDELIRQLQEQLKEQNKL